MTRKRRLSFSVEIFQRYKRIENQQSGTFASVTDSWNQSHELNEQMFLDFLYLIQQELTDYNAADEFLKDKSLELQELRAEKEILQARKEADDVFRRYDKASIERN